MRAQLKLILTGHALHKPAPRVAAGCAAQRNHPCRQTLMQTTRWRWLTTAGASTNTSASASASATRQCRVVGGAPARCRARGPGDTGRAPSAAASRYAAIADDATPQPGWAQARAALGLTRQQVLPTPLAAPRCQQVPAPFPTAVFALSFSFPSPAQLHSG